MSVWVVVGGQFGSEGKGKISAVITLREQIDICIRCGGPNSGHSFRTTDGEFILLRQLPTGFVRPQTRLLHPPADLWISRFCTTKCSHWVWAPTGLVSTGTRW